MKLKVKIDGMHCGGCEVAVKNELEKSGVEVEEISHKEGIAVVSCPHSPEDNCGCTETVVSAVRNAGYKVQGIMEV